MLAQILPGDWLDNTELDAQEVSLLTGFVLNGRHLLFMDDTFVSVYIIVASPFPISEISFIMERNTPKTRKKR